MFLLTSMEPMVFFKDDFAIPAVNGVHNVMKGCLRAKSVRRIVFTSSFMTASPMNDVGEFTKACLDESCWSPITFLKSETNKVAWYTIAKALAEQEALKYGLNNDIDAVSILPDLVIGPWLTATSALTSAQLIFALIGGIHVCVFNCGFCQYIHDFLL